jgi:iron complex outermembrane receptor protein
VTSNFYATGPTTVDGANFRIDGLAAHSDGFRGLTSADYEIRPVVAWEGNGHTVTLSVDARRLENLPDPAGIVYLNGRPANVPRTTKYSTPFGQVNQDYIRTTLSDVWAATSYLTVTNRFSYMHRQDTILRNGDGSTATVTPTGIMVTGRQLRQQSDSLNDFDYQLEPIWKFNTGSIGHTLLTGFEAERRSLFANRATADLPNIANIFAPVIPEVSTAGLSFLRDAKHSGFIDQLDATYLGAYAADQIDVTDKLKLRFTARQNWWDTSLTPQVFVPGRLNASGQVFQPGVNYGRNDSPFDWSAGALYKILPGISPFVGVSSSHLANFSSEATQNGVAAPESALQYEAGLKMATLDERVTVTVSGFYVQRDNVFTLVGDTGFFASQQTHGIEADAQFKVTPDWTILANATLQDAALTANPSNPAAVGNLPIGVPRQIVNLWTSYDFSIAGLSGFKLGGGMTYRDRIFANVQNTTSVPAYTIFDTNLSFTRPHWSASVGIKNITDRTYFINANGGGAFVGDPRTFFVKMNVDF